MGTLSVQRTASPATQDGCRVEFGAVLRGWREIRGVRTYALGCHTHRRLAVCVNSTKYGVRYFVLLYCFQKNQISWP